MTRRAARSNHARRLLSWAGWAVAALFILIAAYGVAGLIGGAIPVNSSWKPAENGIRVFVESNGVHTDLILPKRAAGLVLNRLSDSSALRDPLYGGFDYLAVGWGDRDFYENTPHWADVRPGTILRAAIGSDHTVLHIAHVPGPATGAKSLTLRPEEYRRLIGFIRAHLARNPNARPAYGRSDVFMTAGGRYSAVHTCNDWVGEAFRTAGVRMGAWTPFPTTVLWWFK